jgi:hypothetical protein
MAVSLLFVAGSCVPALGLMTKALFVFLDHHGDRKFARHVFDQTRATDQLGGYASLIEARRNSASTQRPSSKEAIDDLAL